MRGYVEALEREHFHHGDNCHCEIEEPGSGQDYFSDAVLIARTQAAGVSLNPPPPHSKECDCDGCGEWRSQQ